MLAAISTTILLRRSCALTGSAITSRSRRNSTRGPPSAPRIASSFVPSRPGGAPRSALSRLIRERLSRMAHAIANGLCRGQDKDALPRVARRDTAAGGAEFIGIDDAPIGLANGFVLRRDLLRCGRAKQAFLDGGDVDGARRPVELRDVSRQEG